MNFKDFEKAMRSYEDLNDLKLLPELYVVARIDGRNFTKLSRNILKLEPFDLRMRDAMVSAMNYIMDCGFDCVYGYTQSDEISLLIRNNGVFDGKVRKYNSLLASAASVSFSFAVKELFKIKNISLFDCRVFQFPETSKIYDYFIWRMNDSLRNSLNMLCYWTLVSNGYTRSQAGKEMEKKTVDWKHDTLHKYGVNFNNIETWKKRGIGTYWEYYDKPSFDPINGKDIIVKRRNVKVDMELPMHNGDYTNLISSIMEVNNNGNN